MRFDFKNLAHRSCAKKFQQPIFQKSIEGRIFLAVCSLYLQPASGLSRAYFLLIIHPTRLISTPLVFGDSAFQEHFSQKPRAKFCLKRLQPLDMQNAARPAKTDVTQICKQLVSQPSSCWTYFRASHLLTMDC